MSANPAGIRKSLKIKTSSCKRLLKELRAYHKEVERESAKTNRMKDDGEDPHNLKQQENVLAESQMMIPDCKKRLEAALADIQNLLEEAEVEFSQGNEEIEEGKKIVKEIELEIH